MFEEMKNLYNDLFAGSARLGVLLGTLGLPWPKVTPFISLFTEELNNYQELSLDHEGKVLGLMTRGTGKSFTFRAARYMEEHGINEDRIKRFLVRARFFEHQNLFFKIEIDKDGPAEFSYYFRRRPALEAAYAWLQDTGVSEKDCELVKECARILEKETVHFLAAAEKPGGASVQKVYFSQPQDDKAVRRVFDAGRHVGVPGEAWDILKPFKAELRNKSLFFSLSFSGGKPCREIKLDVADVEAGLAKHLLQKTASSQEALDRFLLLFNLTGKNQFDYIGLHLYPDKPLTAKVYVYNQKQDNL